MERSLKLTLPFSTCGRRYDANLEDTVLTGVVKRLTYTIGFSYSETGLGSINPTTGSFENASFDGVKGRFPVIDASKTGKLGL